MEYIDNKKDYLLKRIEDANYPLIDNDLDKTLTSNICKKCLQEGCCCNKYPCIFAPSDFIDITNYKYMKRIIDSELVYVNLSKGDYYTIRPLGKNELYNTHYQNNTCVLYHYKKGCMLEKYLRPTQGLLYIPKKDDYSYCTAVYTKDNIYNEYKPYQEYLRKLHEYQKKINRDFDLFEVPEEKINTLVRSLTNK